MTTPTGEPSAGRGPMRVLITGGAGFIGSNLVLRLRSVRPRWQLRVLDSLTYAANRANLDPVAEDVDFIHGSITDTALVHTLVRDADLVINVAAESHVDNALGDPSAFIDTNIHGTFTLLEAVRRHRVRFHHVSTDEVYGSLALDGPERFTESSPLDPSSPYSASKAGSDLLVTAWIRSFDVAATISRCSNNYGPRQHVEKFIPRQITNILTGVKPKLYGSGLQRRDWIHVDDHTDALVRVLERGRLGQIYLIGADEEHSNRAVLGMILELMGQDSTWFDHVSDRAGHDRRYSVDASKLRTETGWAPRSTDLRTALARTIDWYTRYPDWWQPAKAAAERRYAHGGR